MVLLTYHIGIMMDLKG